MVHVCLIEDEEKVAGFISRGLQELQYQVTVFSEGIAAEQSLLQETYDLVIMDLMLPDIHGFDLCRQVRRISPNIPILMLTALNSIQEKVEGLRSGADDYLVKPFHFSEFVARVEALLRRNRKSTIDAEELVFSDLKLDLQSKTAFRAGKEIILTSKEFGLLELFMRHPNRILSRDFIAEKVWSIQFDTGTNFIDVYVNYLRRKIDTSNQSKLIHTVIGMGYILKNNNLSR
ncbi:DNA-binding response regulator, OmpR family, contains REC and winged-helix (wHTH) domain [Mucilaginibacter pineti]|uniref:DNA-binding response regulator, OmpR family, contains REC and winged-helix (WHTH) domain n=1 Tax=Mucilaginibacter pineti TaxID=1391627 RepID=A0A1G6U2D2_9SPHI|nr:response regulator transcription factor [Mucilaginibacter pineti]SDD35451.1 DNA-binding response regulator, OmpR family, contains REC and winged-helix (wHTH) domain [Mucilaginibacter pineti]